MKIFQFTPANVIVNLKQEPPDEYDIVSSNTSPTVAANDDDIASTVEEQEVEPIEGRRDDNEKVIEQVDISSEDNKEKYSVNNPFRLNLAEDGGSFEAMDYSQSESSQDDASSVGGQWINVMACNENPESGCSFYTSSLSSYQVTFGTK